MNKRTVVILYLVLSFLPLFWGGYQLSGNVTSLFTDQEPTWSVQIILLGILFYTTWIPGVIWLTRSRKY